MRIFSFKSLSFLRFMALFETKISVVMSAMHLFFITSFLKIKQVGYQNTAKRVLYVALHSEGEICAKCLHLLKLERGRGPETSKILKTQGCYKISDLLHSNSLLTMPHIKLYSFTGESRDDLNGEPQGCKLQPCIDCRMRTCYGSQTLKGNSMNAETQGNLAIYYNPFMNCSQF